MEVWDIYDIHRQKTNKTINRNEKLNEGEFHLMVHACIFNSKGQLLIQQRQSFKSGSPNMWDVSVGGHGMMGETSQQAMMREIKEEIGLEFDLDGIRPHFTINFGDTFDDYYIIEKDVELNDCILEISEVQNIKWASLEEILEMINQGIFINYYEEFIGLLFQMRKKYGTHKK